MVFTFFGEAGWDAIKVLHTQANTASADGDTV